MTEESIFELVVSAPESQRQAILDRECAGDENLRARLQALLAADGNPEFTIDQPQRHSESSVASVGTAGSTIAGKYKLIEAIGEGGMGSVWLAQQTEPVKRRVAVKLIKAGMDSKAVLARFEAERQALALMDHPNIAKVLDGGLHEGRPFFVMELFKGLPITEYCDAVKLNPRERLELFVPVCQAIQHAHQKGIIHRDIKPSNVLVALYDDKPVPKVIDFGLAKATGGSLTDISMNTAFGGVVGTPQYMSPEQASLNNLDIDTRSDVYSLGILLYELLTGSPPFKKKELEKAGMLEILRWVREEEPPKPSTKLSTSEALPSLSANRGTEPKKLTELLRSELDWIVLKALEKDRTRRYDTANGFAADVQRYLSGEAVQAHPPSAGYRAKKFLRRYRRPVIAGGVLVLAMMAGIAGTSWGLVRASAERDKARQAESEARAAELEAQNQANIASRERDIASLERDKAAKERDEKETARSLEREARQVAQDRLVRSHVRSGSTATERDEGFNALHWYNAAWQADAENPERDAIHRLRIGSALRQLPELQAVRIYSEILQECAFSPDGRKVLSYTKASDDLDIWSPNTGRLIVAPLSHPAPILSAEWTVNGKFLFTWADDHALRVWDAETGKLVGQPIYSQGKQPLAAVGLSPDGKTGLIAEKQAGTIVSVEVGTGKTLKTWTTDSSEDPISLRFSPTGDRFVSAIRDKAILWDPNQVELIASVPHYSGKLQDYNNSVTHTRENPSVARLPIFSPDGRRFITLPPNDHGFCVWDSESGKMIAKQNQAYQTYGLQISPSGQLVLTYGNSVPGYWLFSICELETGRVVLGTKGPRTVNNATFLPDEKSVLYAMSGGDVARADIASGRSYGPILRTSSGGQFIPQVSPDGRTVLIADSDGIAKVWKLASINPWSSYDIALGGPTNGRFATRDGQVRVEQVNGVVEVRQGSGEPKVLENAPKDEHCWLSPDGLHAVLTDGRNAYRVWDTSTGKPVTDWFAGAGEQSEFPQAFFTPDNKYLYTAGVNGAFECRAVSTGNLVANRNIQFISSFISPYARCTKVSPDGKWLAVGHGGADAFLFSIDDPKKKPLKLKNITNVWSVDFSADSRFVATAGGDLTARVWEVDTGKPAGPSMRSPYAFRQIVFSPDGNAVLTLDHSGFTKLWDWKTADLVAAFPRIVSDDNHRSWFSPDGRFAVCHPGSPTAKPVCFPIDRFALPREEFPNFITLLTAQQMDETEAIVPLRLAETPQGKDNFRKVWLKLHPELASPDPLEPAQVEKVITATTKSDLPREWLTPEQASKRVGETVTVKMTVRSIGKSRDGNNGYLNSTTDQRNADNFEVLILGITPERLEKLGLPQNFESLDRTIIAQGKVGIVKEKPQLRIDESSKIWILPPEPTE